ncbi:sodium-dependent transporter [Pseudalkalibacillus berkeleyi]|uniref:Transporter n=1 Tax=Pseudalkalibacillus berkeleyi TaxID=1069813 RepID=A0ABS9H2L3_9BACL|nr:sodium-dependent transporter [Pseudalkalibacillus berkeleyi]MCF6139187.1 sodium-dependent transporter [Pseudalkalibacillus berkeleyi]
MSQGLEQQGREQWKSRTGFMLAAMGSAIGLGNIWKFPYITGENGGGAFIIVYLICIALIGIPIMLAEFSVGRNTQKDAVGSFKELTPGKPWFITGIFGVMSAFLILSFYGVVAGWALSYTTKAISGDLLAVPAEKMADHFGGFIGASLGPIIWQLLFMGLVIIIVVKGIKQGIEKWNKILMPTLGILLVVLAIRGLTLPGSGEGFSFLFSPDFSALNAEAVLVALGHAFFSLSLGMGTMITYGSYVPQNVKLPTAAVGVSMADTGFALLAGLAIFPAVFAFGMDPGAGPGLIFITLPAVFEQMPLGQFFSILFFLLISMAALTSAISILEVPVAYFMRKFEWTRKKATWILGTIIFLFGVPSSLSLGAWSEFTIFGKGFFDAVDYLASNILLPLGGLLTALFVGWALGKKKSLEIGGLREGGLWGMLWIWSLRLVAPILILIVMASVLGFI